jgi:hypothetical protein
MSMPSAITLLRGVVSLPIMAGAGMLAMGMKLVPVDPNLAAIAKVFIGDAIPLLTFLRILGAAKVAAAVSFWGRGPLPHDGAVLGMSISALCGAYGHYVVEGTLQALVPVIYMMLLATYFVWNRAGNPTTNNKNE